MSTNYLLVDGQNLAHASNFLPGFRRVNEQGVEEQLRAPDGEIITVFKSTLNMLGRLLKQIGPHQIIMAFDGSEQPWRYDLEPNYKGGRKGMKNLNLEDPEKAIDYLVTNRGFEPKVARDRVEFGLQLRRLPQHFRDMGMLVVSHPILEGDDVVALLAEHPEIAPHEKVLYSNDRDLLAYVDDKTYFCSPTVQKVVKPGNFDDYVHKVFKFRSKPVTPAEWPVFRAFVGDKQDHIMGVDGCGPYYAGVIINALSDEGVKLTGYRQDIMEVLPSLKDIQPRLPKNVQPFVDTSNLEVLRHWYNVVRVENAPEEAKQTIRTLDLTPETPATTENITQKLQAVNFKQWVDDPAWIKRFTPDPQPELQL